MAGTKFYCLVAQESGGPVMTQKFAGSRALDRPQAPSSRPRFVPRLHEVPRSRRSCKRSLKVVGRRQPWPSRGSKALIEPAVDAQPVLPRGGGHKTAQEALGPRNWRPRPRSKPLLDIAVKTSSSGSPFCRKNVPRAIRPRYRPEAGSATAPQPARRYRVLELLQESGGRDRLCWI